MTARPTVLIFGPPGSGVETVAEEVRAAGMVAESWDGTTGWGPAEDPAELGSNRWSLLLRLECRTEWCLGPVGCSGTLVPARSVAEAMELLRTSRERQRSARIRTRAVLDTTGLNAAALRGLVRRLLGAGLGQEVGPLFAVSSFAFPEGIPLDLDWCVDARALRNPYWDEALRPLSGLDPEVRRFVLKQPLASQLLEGMERTVGDQLSAWTGQHRPLVRIGVGCTGGFHRSVAIVEEFRRRSEQSGIRAVQWHRELRD
ncbi:MAG TPA: RNase adapter RapZ [Candidatus Dormibacteraeota bacterium]|nr:RNase adapter RapZ [Candidatus Dormibacteraeota bacterium]